MVSLFCISDEIVSLQYLLGTKGGMGEVGGSRMANLGGSPAERRQEILETTLQAVKRCQVSERTLFSCAATPQVRYGGKQELATEGSDEVQGLLTR